MKLALRFNFDGVYIPAFKKTLNYQNISKKNFEVIGSAHNIKEMRIKEIQNVSSIFISSIFKKNKNFLGIYKFIKLKKLTKRKVIALGGISKSNQKKLNLISIDGFSGISYFEQKKGPSKGAFN